jgi:Uncharacterized conserved protein
LLEPAAQRMGEALETAMREQMPDDVGPMAGMFTQLGPLLQGTQVGQVLGFLATRVLGQFDVAVPRQAGAGALLFVISNIARFEHDWSLDPTEFRTSVAIHEVTHRLEFARPWTSTQFVSLVDDFLSTLTVDVARSRSGSRPSTRPTRKRWNGRSAGRVATRCSGPCSTMSNG